MAEIVRSLKLFLMILWIAAVPTQNIDLGSVKSFVPAYHFTRIGLPCRTATPSPPFCQMLAFTTAAFAFVYVLVGILKRRMRYNH
jgi:hypothetical protein